MSLAIRILGIDPGSQITGYGVIDTDGQRAVYVNSGSIRTRGGDFAGRLREIFLGAGELIATYQPTEISIERVFMHRNADSALKLGHARAAALCATFSHAIPVHEYSPRQIKQSVVGQGGADKEQVAHMVKVLLSLSGELQSDAADALAVALCHAHLRRASQALAVAGGTAES